MYDDVHLFNVNFIHGFLLAYELIKYMYVHVH